MKTAIQNIRLVIVLVITILTGCKNDEKVEFTDSPIIESYLKPGNYFNVNITRQIPFSLNAVYSTDDVNNLAITLSYNNLSHILTPLGNGQYIDSLIQVTEGAHFNLSFLYNSKTVTAYTYIPSKPVNMKRSASQIIIPRMDSTSFPTMGDMPEPVKITWDNNDGSYYLIIVENLESTLDPIRDFGDAEPPDNIFRKSPTNSNTEELSPMDFQYYGTHRIVLYHVLPDYASLYDQNTSSSQNLTNPSTSIVNGYGIFTGLNSATLYIEVKEE